MAVYESLQVKDFATELDSVVSCQSDDQIGKVLNDLDSTHQTVFVMDGKQLVGLVSPREALYHHRYPHHTKVKNVMVDPVKIQSTTPLYVAAEFMVGTKMYMLPVFEGEKLVGVIDADDMLRPLLSDETIWPDLNEKISISKPKTADMDTPSNKIYAQLREQNISRLVLTDNKGKVEGIVSRRDILPIFVMPDRERTSAQEMVNYDHEVATRNTTPAHVFMSPFVITSSPGKSFEEYLAIMMDKQVHSLVLVNDENAPVGFISRNDYLRGLSRMKPIERVPITFTAASSNVKEELYEQVGRLMAELFVHKYHKRHPLQRLEVKLKQTKNGVGKSKSFSARVKVLLKSGEIINGEGSQVRVDQAVREALTKAARQRPLSE